MCLTAYVVFLIVQAFAKGNPIVFTEPYFSEGTTAQNNPFVSTVAGCHPMEQCVQSSCVILAIPAVQPPPAGNKTVVTVRHTLNLPKSHPPGECGLWA